MSIQASSVTTPNNLFNQIPLDTLNEVCEYMGDLILISKCTCVCKQWYALIHKQETDQKHKQDVDKKDNTENAPPEKTRYEKAIARLRIRAEHQRIEQDYHPVLRQVFAQSNLPIWSLPELILNPHDNRDYIDFLTRQDMTHPVMRLRDQRNRFGVALYICSHNNDLIQQIARSSLVEALMRDNPLMQAEYHQFIQERPLFENVLAIFQRHPNSHHMWTIGWGHSNGRIEGIFQNIHRDSGTHTTDLITSCPACPFRNRVNEIPIHPSVLSDLLTGKDINFELPGVKDLPHHQPEPPLPERVAVFIIDLMRKEEEGISETEQRLQRVVTSRITKASLNCALGNDANPALC